MPFRFIIAVLIISSWGSCNRKEGKQPADEAPVAQVGEATLSRSEVNDLVPQGASTADSAALVSRYLDAWVKKKLKLEQARQQLPADQSDIEKRVEEYR